MTTTEFEPNEDQTEALNTGDDTDHLELDQEESDEDQTDDSAEDTSGDQSATKSSSSGARRPRPAKLTRKQVVSILDAREQVASTTDQVRGIAATLLGVADADDYDGLTVAVVTADRSAYRAVESLSSIAEIDEQLERVVAISTWDKTTASSAWKLLHELDLVSRQLPSNNAKAAAAIAKAADELPDALTTVADLLGR